MSNIEASVGEVNRALGVVVKSSQGFAVEADHLAPLSARAATWRATMTFRQLRASPEGVTGKRSRFRFLPGHNHPGVESARERHGDC